MTYDLDDAAEQNAEAGRDAAADFADSSAQWSAAEWDAYEAEMRAEYDQAMGPPVSAATAAEWEREAALDARDAWDESVPLAEFDDVPW